MTEKMKVLIPYCGVGGTAMGWHRAGFEVVGIDIQDQPDFPFTMVKGNALEIIGDIWRDFDVVDAAPPCQYSSALTKGTNQGRVYPNLIPPTRKLLEGIDRPWIIENVAGAQLRKDYRLCGTMFGLRVFRHRFYETSGIPKLYPYHTKHTDRVAGYRHGVWYDGNMVAVYGDGGGKGSVETWREAMGIDWTWCRGCIAEAIPPRYSEWYAKQVKEFLTR